MAGSLFDEKSLDLESFGAARSKKTSVSQNIYILSTFSQTISILLKN